MSSRAKMKKRRARLARAERERMKAQQLKDQREYEQFRREYANFMHRLYGRDMRRHNAWYRRLLRRLTGGYFG